MFNWIFALLPFALFCFLSVIFTRRRFSVAVTYSVWAVVIAAVSVVHIVLFSLNRGDALLLSLMPVTAYLPVVVAYFVLSSRNLASNVLAVLIAALSSVSVILLNAFSTRLWANAIESAETSAAVFNAVEFIVLTGASAALGCVCYRCLRKIFERERVIGNRTWYVLPAVFMLLMLSLYQMEVLKQPMPIAFLLVMNVFVLVVITALIVTKFKNVAADAERLAVERQLAAEREQYGALKESIETDKRYRHDIKHHFCAIAEMACKGSNREIAEYVDTLGAKLTDAETKWYCVNGVVNAMLSAFVKRAEGAGVECAVEAVVPEKPLADEYDLCTLVGNALDNAVNACAKMAEGSEKKIEASIMCEDNKIVVKVANTTTGDVPLGKDGLPVCETTDEHGWGMSSIKHIVESYGGIMKCSCEGGTFMLMTVLFGRPQQPPPKKSKGQKVLYSFASVPLILFIAILFINSMPSTASALERIPVFGKAIEIVDFRNRGWEWGDSKIDIEEPITNDPDANAIIAGYVKECREKFEWYYARKYHGYVYSEFTSKEIVNDDRLYVLRMSCIIQAGSSAEYMRYMVVDKDSGEIVSLPSLFAEGSDWNTVVTDEIRRQMQAIVDADEGDFFGFGRGADEEGLTRLDDPNFYIDENNRLVIVFDRYEVAPGSMGSPSFVIPYDAVKEILSEESILKEGA